jgi:uncharacterized protein YodC (DUF2158 family)
MTSGDLILFDTPLRLRNNKMSDFKKGDVVQLKSGGPNMTIQDLGDYSFGGNSENGALCVWFDKTKSEEKVFDLAVLDKVSAAAFTVTSI